MTTFEVGLRVQVKERKQLKGEVRVVHSQQYVGVKFDGIEELVGVNTDRLELET